MSTYNGEKYIKEQLDSIRAQDYPELSLLIRDDGSTDTTVEVVQDYILANKDMDISLIKGENLGVLDGFMSLVDLSDDACDYYAFADQDDVWFKDKISRGIAALEADDEALIYAGSYLPVDENLKEIPFKDYEKRPDFFNSIVENIAIGCTIVFNHRMKNLTAGVDIRSACIHDWWFYILATAVGRIVFDKEPSLYYRQHSGNAIGSKDSIYKKWKTRFRRLNDWSKEIFIHCELLLEHYKENMSPEKIQVLEELLSYKKLNIFGRLAYIHKTPIFRQTRLDQFLFKLLLLFKRIG